MNGKAKKALKITLWTITSLLALVVFLLLTSPLWLGPTAKTIANSIVPEKVGTKFEIKNMSLNIFSGKFLIEGTCLNNPEGYKPAEAAKVGKLFVHLNMGSVFSDVIHIKEISIDEIFASYVSNNGTNNFEWISNYVASQSEEEEKEEVIEEKEKEETPGKKVIIDRLAISNTKVQFEFIPIPLPDLTVTDIGKESEGATLSEALQEIWVYIKKNLTAAGGAIGSLLNTIGSGLGDTAGEAAKTVSDAAGKAMDAAGNATKSVTDAAGKAMDAAGNATKSVTDAANKAVDATTDAVGNAVDAAGEGLNKATDAVSEGASKLFKKAGGLFGK